VNAMQIMLAVIGALAAYSFASLRILKQYERGVAFFLGKYWGTKGPGLVFVPAGFTHLRRVSLRIVAMDVPPQDVITRDNVSIKVNAVLYMRVKNPEMAIIEIEDYLYATSQLAQTTLRSVLGQAELDELLADREKINAILQKIVEERTDSWGVEVSAVEVKDVDLPVEMKRAMARQAEAERERRAKVIAAEGEFQAAGKLSEAAAVIARHPEALQLRYLQTLVEVASENNSTTIFPVPIDLLTPFMDMGRRAASAAAEAAAAAAAGTTDAAKSLPSATGAPVPAAERERTRTP
jgi:regulator of protease activity HflC (stomatin/prohibitin superfamily)